MDQTICRKTISVGSFDNYGELQRLELVLRYRVGAYLTRYFECTFWVWKSIEIKMRFHYNFSSIVVAQSSGSTEWRILIAPCKTLKPHQRESQKCPMQQWKSPLRTYSLGRFAVRTVSTKYLCKDQIMNWIKFWASSHEENNKITLCSLSTAWL